MRAANNHTLPPHPSSSNNSSWLGWGGGSTAGSNSNSAAAVDRGRRALNSTAAAAAVSADVLVGFATVRVPPKPAQIDQQQQEEQQQEEEDRSFRIQRQEEARSLALRALLAAGPTSLQSKGSSLGVLLGLVEHWNLMGEVPTDAWWQALERWVSAVLQREAAYGGALCCVEGAVAGLASQG